MIALQGSWSSAKGDVIRPTLHELAAIENRGARLWFHEEEFSRAPQLRAEPHHVVILQLEGGDRKGKPIRNTIPYRFTRTASYTFCIPKDEPHIRSIELRRDGGKGSGVEVQVPHGAGCKTRTIAAGLYQLHVEHDGSRIGAAGEKAFISVPSAQTSFPLCSDLNQNFSNDARVLFAAPDGSYVGQDFNTGKVVTKATLGGDASAVWVICHDQSGNYQVYWPTAFGPPSIFVAKAPPNSDTAIYALSEDTGSTPTNFQLTDLGNGQFTLAALFGGTPYPIVLGSDGALHWATSGTPTTFTIVLKYYFDGIAAQPLQPGETALYQACNYDVSATGTWVFNTNIADFAPFKFTTLGISLDNTVASAKPGPQTIATLYANPNLSGASQVIAADTPCLNGTALGSNAASSLKIEPARQFVARTGACEYCNLSGVDLSNLDLTGGSFKGSTFTGANLTSTNFQSAILDSAKLRSYSSEGGPTILNGTDFLGAHLQCTDFQDSDLRAAFFVSGGTPPVLPVITKDFSCRLQLQYATLKLATFPLTDWRYFILNGAAITDASGQVLSSSGNPLDLSKAQLSGTTGLTQVDLTSANIAGANFTGTNLTGAILHKATTIDPVSGANSPVLFTKAILNNATLDYAILDNAQFNNASLSKANLRRVSLKNALLQGANISFSNLDGANMCAAKLNQSPDQNVSASLQGAFLRNVNLSQADLTGASLASADFYSSAPSSAATCNPASCGFSSSCASAVSARFNNTDFSGAYVAGVDFSNSFPQSVDFTGATLSGSNFTDANLTQDITTGKRTDFTDTFLQGTIFTNATVTGANFTGAVVDLTTASGQTIHEQLNPAAHVAFPAYTPSPGSTPGCVQFTTNRKTVLPQTDSSNICPNSGSGPCTTAQWQAIAPPTPPVCTVDFNWLFVTY
ncbi:MAG: pentapeptide repeat-containing protein [Candidatus Binatia bacterium]